MAASIGVSGSCPIATSAYGLRAIRSATANCLNILPKARGIFAHERSRRVGPGQIMTWGKTVENKVEGFGFQWSLPGQSRKHILFDWTGPAHG